MKYALLLAFVLSLIFSQFALAQKQSTLQSDITALQKISDQRMQELNSLENFYFRISAEVILTNLLIENISNGIATRARCTAACAGGFVSCSGTSCTAEDGIGCIAVGGPNGWVIKDCPLGGSGGPVGVSSG